MHWVESVVDYGFPLIRLPKKLLGDIEAMNTACVALSFPLIRLPKKLLGCGFREISDYLEVSINSTSEEVVGLKFCLLAGDL